MKLNTEVSDVSTNNDDIQSMDFGIGDVSTIIDILRNRLYSNPIRTLTQEYLCNGRDSHREAGRENTPIKVTLPTRLESTLKIRDYGVGLSPDRVRDVFVNYGSSTKRKDNIQTGGFGIGAKSAWAYTDSFVIVSYYEGIARTYAAHTGKNSNGTLELINEENTSEPNGVEVQIPVKQSDIEFFVNAVYRCTFFWDVKPDLRGITEVEIPKDYTNLDKNIVSREKNWLLLNKTELAKRLFDAHNAEIFVLIDKIPYSINKFLRECPEVEKLRSATSAPNSINFIEVDNGVLEVSATRESISDKDSSKEKVNQLCKEVNQILADHVNNIFKQETNTVGEFVGKVSKCKEVFHLGHIVGFKDENFSRNGEEFIFTNSGVRYSVKNNTLSSVSCSVFDQFYLEKQKSRHVLKRIENASINLFNREIKDIKFILMDEDEKSMSELAFKEKIRSLILSSGDPAATGYSAIVYLAKQFDLEKSSVIRKFLDAKYFSDIEVEKSPTKPKKEQGKVTIRKLDTNGNRYSEKVETTNRRDVSLEEIVDSGTTYVLVPFSSEEIYEPDNKEFAQNIKFIYSQNKEMEVVKCSKKEYEVLCLLDNTIEYCDIIEEFPKYIELKESVIRDHLTHSDDNSLEVVRKYLNDIRCEKIKSYFGSIPARPNNQYNTKTDIPERILKQYESFNSAMKQKDKIEQLKQEILNDYPLIKYMSHFNAYSYGYGRNNDNDTLIKEVIFYINSKAQKK